MDFVDVIIREFKRKNQKNKLFSLRAFAAKVEVDPSVLSKIMSRKRGLSVDLARQISNRLELSAEDRALLPSELLIEEHPVAEYSCANVLAPLIVAYLQVYQDHSIPAIAEYLELPSADIEECIEFLKAKKIINLEGSSFLVDDEDLFLNLKEELKGARSFYRNYYCERWQRAEEQPKVQNLSLLIPFDEQSAKLMEEEMMNVAKRLNSIFADYTPPKQLYSVLFSAFPVGKTAK